MHIKYFKKIETSILMAIVLTAAISLSGFAASCEGIEHSVLRMHVIANSDEKYDQELKLKVRDAVIKEGKDVFSGATDVKEAQRKIEASQDKLLEVAKRVIKEEGYDYDVRIEIGEEYFGTRSYDEITLPAGQYQAVRIIIGEGAGKNWWCVMFPPLCLPGASEKVEIDAVLTDGESKVVKSNPKIDARFKVVEIYEKVMDAVKSKDENKLKDAHEVKDEHKKN
ncbi:MAG: stage II sporulation protein R [Clostridia bacterium]|nr:stage II sporulation protein R [Clostridia bacterium]